MGSKPSTPAPTAEQVELERRARKSSDDLLREENQRLKGLKRGRQGRRSLLGSGSELGVTGVRGGGRNDGTLNRVPNDGAGGSTRSASGGGIMSGGQSRSATGYKSSRRVRNTANRPIGK